MNILLISPQTPDTFWSFKHVLRFCLQAGLVPAAGFAHRGGHVAPDWELRLVDLNVKRLKDADLRWADFVMVSAMIVQKDSVRNIVRRCLDHGKTVIAGGPLFTTGHEGFPEIRHFVLGEAEEVMPQLVEDMRHNRLQPIYKAPAGRTWRKRPFRAGI